MPPKTPSWSSERWTCDAVGVWKIFEGAFIAEEVLIE
jgi:hypothetical protein